MLSCWKLQFVINTSGTIPERDIPSSIVMQCFLQHYLQSSVQSYDYDMESEVVIPSAGILNLLRIFKIEFNITTAFVLISAGNKMEKTARRHDFIFSEIYHFYFYYVLYHV